MAYPDTELALKIPPAFPIPIQYGVGTLLAVDILGALRGWRSVISYANLKILLIFMIQILQSLGTPRRRSFRGLLLGVRIRVMGSLAGNHSW